MTTSTDTIERVMSPKNEKIEAEIRSKSDFMNNGKSRSQRKDFMVKNRNESLIGQKTYKETEHGRGRCDHDPQRVFMQKT